MLYRRLGRSGLQVSVISLGAWATVGESLDLAGTTRLMAEAFEAGINLYDNAETYGDGEAERLMGRALRQLNWPRESYLVSSKVFWGTGGIGPTARGLSRKHVFEACDQALARLGLEHLDLYLCHRPDPEAPVEETVRAMSDLVSHHGKVLYWGTSEWPADLIVEADRFARANGLVPPTTEQAQYNLFVRHRVEKEYVDLYERLGLGLTVWSPLAYGLLAGRYRSSVPADARLGRPGYEWLREEILGERERERLAAAGRFALLADQHGVSPARLSMAWVLSNPNVSTAITGASNPAQLRDTLGALELIEAGTVKALGDGLEALFAGS
ncbi:MAG: aldo/keto reductase [Solirubrobacterales bacterium]